MKQIFLLPHLITLDSCYRSIQYNILNNVLYLNKKLFMLQKWTSPLCSFRRLSDETVPHLFYECDKIQNLWNDLALSFENDFAQYITPQPSFLSFVNADLKLISIL